MRSTSSGLKLSKDVRVCLTAKHPYTTNGARHDVPGPRYSCDRNIEMSPSSGASSLAATKIRQSTLLRMMHQTSHFLFEFSIRRTRYDRHLQNTTRLPTTTAVDRPELLRAPALTGSRPPLLTLVWPRYTSTYYLYSFVQTLAQ